MEVINYQNDANNLLFHKLFEKTNIRQPVKEISEKTRTDKGQVSKIINNKIPVSDNFIRKFAEAYNIDLEDQSIVSEPATEYSTKKRVPFYDIDFTSSFLEITNNQNSTPDSYISHPFFHGCDYVVRNSGQSMAKVICHGDAIGLIEVKNWREFFPFGEIYAIVTNDNFRMIKVITKGETDDFYTLISKPTDSKRDEFPPQQIRKNTIISIFKVQASSHLF